MMPSLAVTVGNRDRIYLQGRARSPACSAPGLIRPAATRPRCHHPGAHWARSLGTGFDSARPTRSWQPARGSRPCCRCAPFCRRCRWQRCCLPITLLSSGRRSRCDAYIARNNDATGRWAARQLSCRAQAGGIETITLAPRLKDFNDDLPQLGVAALRATLRKQLVPEDLSRFMAPEAITVR